MTNPQQIVREALAALDNIRKYTEEGFIEPPLGLQFDIVEQALDDCFPKWRPIDEAPKDGTVFIAYYDDRSGVVKCKWASPEDDYNAVGDYWIDPDDGQELTGDIDIWMPIPLPTPPMEDE